MLLDQIAKHQSRIAQGGLTNSKFHASFPENAPYFIERAYGPYCYTKEGEQFIDLSAALGAISIGHNETSVLEAVQKQLIKGNLFTMASSIESECADFLLTEFLTDYDAVKYLKTGAEATTGAITIARSATGRQRIITQGYHGHHPHWCSTKPTHFGVMDHFYFKEYPTVDDILKLPVSDLQSVAAVIVEALFLDDDEYSILNLIKLKELCDKSGTLLILDEIITGFRVDTAFVSKLIKPNLICIGKGIANGFSLSGIVGSKELMHETPYFISSTFAGETIPLAAHLAVMKYIKNNNLKGFCEWAKNLMKRIKLPKGITYEGYGTRGYFKGENFTHFQQEAIKAKLLFNPSPFLNFSHQPLEKVILSSFDDACYSMERTNLEGRPARSNFKRL